MHFNLLVQLALMLPFIAYAAPLGPGSVVVHLDPTGTFSLFHGTREAFSPPVDLSKSVKVGDFHHVSGTQLVVFFPPISDDGYIAEVLGAFT